MGQACPALIQRINSQADLGALDLQHQKAASINKDNRGSQPARRCQPAMRHVVSRQGEGQWMKHLVADGREHKVTRRLAHL